MQPTSANGTSQITTFCQSNLWDVNLSWNTTSPQLTQCFQRTILVWIPAIVLVCLAPLDVYFTSISKTRNIPWSFLNVSKTFLTVSLIVLNIVEFGYEFENGQMDATFVPLIKALIFSFVLVLTRFHKMKGIRSSGPIFIFWLVITGCEILRYHSLDDVVDISQVVQLSIIALIFLLNFWADKEPKITIYPKDSLPCPEVRSSFPSKIFYTWYDPFIWKSFRKNLEFSDLWNLSYEHTTGYLAPIFNRLWSEQSGKNQVSALTVIRKIITARFLLGSLCKLIDTLLAFAVPLLIGAIINFVEYADSEPVWKGYFYAILFLVAETTMTLVSNQFYHLKFENGLHIQTCFITAIYEKSLRISQDTRRSYTAGEIINLMAVDAQRFQDLSNMDLIWSAPLQAVVCVYLLWTLLGVSVFIGLSSLLVIIPLNMYFTSKWKTYQAKQMIYKDKRTKLMAELLNSMKILKLYAWELGFENQVLHVRQKEMDILKRTYYMDSVISFFWSATPYVLSLIMFTSYVLIDKNNVLDYRTAFVSLSLLDNLRSPMIMLPIMISNFVQMSVSLKRINVFLNSQETSDTNTTRSKDKDGAAITVTDGTFSWGEDIILRNINLTFENASLTAVVGTVGAGKTSLLNALLGEMNKVSGSVSINGNIAYVSQQAWIQNATLRDNITFGSPYIESKYKKVVEACALSMDFRLLPAGDLTEIGENGTNLSGGQKQRLNLARAVYSDRDIYILDDPLSAVDVQVGKHIFEKLIGPSGLLKSKTRILVTHSISFLPTMDKIIVLSQGRIKEMGSYRELILRSNDFSNFINEYSQQHPLTEDATSSMVVDKRRSTGSVKDFNSMNVLDEIQGKLTEVEGMETGSVKWSTYAYYIKSIGLVIFLGTLFTNCLFQGSRIGNNYWVSIWSGDEHSEYHSAIFYILIYSIIGFVQSLSCGFLDLIPLLGCWKATREIHKQMLRSILRAPIQFFNSVPMGRIISRFAKDISVVDSQIPNWFADSIYGLIALLSVLTVMCATLPYLTLFVIPSMIFFGLIRQLYTITSRQLKRLESVSRTPIFSHFSETLSGVQLIRAYDAQERFIQHSRHLVDLNNMCYYPYIMANRWISVRLEILSNSIIFASAVFFVVYRFEISAGVVGFCLSYSINLIGIIGWWVLNTSQLEANMVSVERLEEYCNIKQEAPWDTPIEAPPSWPDKGEIVFMDYSLRYRPDLDLALKNLTFSINSEEKIGIVGRTGAGKSSLSLALFRILEAASGSIMIDGIDIHTLGLHYLRNHITVIPQDPVLFSGTIRFNLDPMNKYSDAKLWEALEQAHLKDFIETLTGQLDHEVTEDGSNFSVGQRQLLCLARALLRKTKILLLDEATAAVDLETDYLIQSTIKKEFADCTVLTIAHRLSTVMDSDRILVIDQGRLVEFNTPENLLLNDRSLFYKMVKEMK